MAFINRLIKPLPSLGGRAQVEDEQDVESGAVQEQESEKQDGSPGYATTSETFTYNELMANQIKLIANTRIESKQNPPSEDDYKKGFFMRYFVKRYDSLPTEVDKDTLATVKEKSADSPGLYSTAAIKWHLSVERLDLLLDLTNDSVLMKVKSMELGQMKRDVSKVNERYTMIANNRCPGIMDVIDENYTEYTVEKSTDSVKSYLYTNGSEFKRPNGQDYVGYYHIHSSKGAMVGAKHSDKAHDKLISVKDLDIKVKSVSYTPSTQNDTNNYNSMVQESPATSPDASTGGGGNTSSY